MKFAAFIDDGLRGIDFYRDYIAQIKALTGADSVAAIMGGWILHSGFLPPENRDSRCRKLRDAGADLVIELPVHGAILKPDTYASVMAMLLQKLGCIDTLVLPCRKGDKEFLMKAAQVMVLAPREYQQALRKLRSGRELFSIIPEAVDCVLPGAEQVMRDPMNRFAVEVRNAMLLSYCPTKALLTEVDFDMPAEEFTPETDEKLGALFSKKLAAMDDAALTEIFGSSDSRNRKLRALSCGSFTGCCDALAAPDFSAHSARQFLLRCLLDFRHITHSMCALHSYIFCIRILGDAAPEAEAELRRKAGTAVTAGENPELITDTEHRAQALWEVLYR